MDMIEVAIAPNAWKKPEYLSFRSKMHICLFISNYPIYNFHF